jgi:hypothetical protein
MEDGAESRRLAGSAEPRGPRPPPPSGAGRGLRRLAGRTRASSQPRGRAGRPAACWSGRQRADQIAVEEHGLRTRLVLGRTGGSVVVCGRGAATRAGAGMVWGPDRRLFAHGSPELRTQRVIGGVGGKPRGLKPRVGEAGVSPIPLCATRFRSFHAAEDPS